MEPAKSIITMMLTVAIALMTAALPVDARFIENRPPSRPVVMTGVLEVQFEADVSDTRLVASDDKVSFGIETLDKSLELIGVTSADRIFPGQNIKSAVYGSYDLTKFYTLKIPDNADLNQAMEELKQNPYVRSVNLIYAMPVDMDPNDPSFVSQWGLKKINDTAASNIENGSDTAKIAIIDTGVLYSHLDLIDNIWVNPGEDLDSDMVVFDLEDRNNLDNDGNYYDDLIGYDFFSGFSGLTCWTGEDCGTPDNDPIDFNGHGTHCAGIAAAVTNNSLGVAGIAGGWGGGQGAYSGSKIICLRAGGSAVDPDYGYETGYIRGDNAATALSNAVDVGACVVNMSFGLGYSGSMSAALIKARDSGVVVCHAAGNEGADDPDFYDTWLPDGVNKTVISVAWTNNSDLRDASSNFGTWIDISAPGTNIYSTYSNHHTSNNDYSYASGTSMAAPHVAGVVALVKAMMPDYGRDEIMPILYAGADPMPGETLWLQGKMGVGRVNANNCVSVLPAGKFSVHNNLGEAPLQVDFVDESPFNPTSWDWDFGDGGSSADQNPSYIFEDYGLYNVALTVSDDNGTGSEVMNNVVMVTADTIKFETISAKPYDTIEVKVYFDNKYQLKHIYFPFMIRKTNGAVADHSKIKADSVIVEGYRAGYFERVQKQSSSILSNKYLYVMNPNYLDGGSNYLDADTGVVFSIRMPIGPHSTTTTYKIRDTLISGYELEFGSIYNNYRPVFIDGTVNVSTCERGDGNLDGIINILDITHLIEWLYQGGYIPPDPVCGDADANGILNILDITYLIAFLYQSGPPPPE